MNLFTRAASFSKSAASFLGWIKRIVFFGLAVLGTICIAALVAPNALKILFPSSTEVKIRNSSNETGVGNVTYSPDGKYKVIHFNENGGGGISPFCFDYISVAPVSVADNATNQDSYRVYAGSCHSLEPVHAPDKPALVASAPLVQWQSNSVLELTFDPTMAASGINEFKLRGWDATGKIRVIHHQPIKNK